MMLLLEVIFSLECLVHVWFKALEVLFDPMHGLRMKDLFKSAFELSNINPDHALNQYQKTLFA